MTDDPVEPGPVPADDASSEALKVLGVALAVVAGFGVALQSRVNGTLADRVDSGFLAAAISFGSGLLWLALALVVSRRSRAALGQVVTRLREGGPRGGGLRWWECLGGAAGGFLVATQGLTVGALGVAIFIVAIVAGQSVSSLLVDRLGLAPGGVRLITVGRAVGPALTVVAVLVAVWGDLGSPATLALAVLPLLAGVGSAWQQAVNGRVRAAAGTGSGGIVAATFLNFVVGTAVLLVALGISVLVRGVPHGALPPEPLLYTGGLIGIAFIAISAAVVHRVGVLLLGLGMIAGQVVGALLLDVVTPGAQPPGAATYVGAALTLVAVAVPALTTRRRRR
ncbi:EamA-like transporter family protein [Xylanimonas oleitrophica]|uniref:EamA-like transporter family protein n=1 Tax=Xylanimonas oleitrophica TaxID=2607479 RepID=A0A2W5WQ59_9MICO|nr:DMT family transporter [Xylanimonas oleitrophica]PZR53082.1 EamA-like transporter family protein [Xylanimonas oleitrophica]